MAQVVDIKRVEIGPSYVTARVYIDESAPLMTSEDLEGTARVYHLLPHIIEHVCLGDKGETFKDVMGDTELAHLLEHVTVEILAQTDVAGDVTYGRTYAVEGEPRVYDIEFPCPDDVLVLGALSSASWILQWAYAGGEDSAPDIDATVKGLVGLLGSLPQPPAPQPATREYVVEGNDARAVLEELGLLDELEEDELPLPEVPEDEGTAVPSWLESTDEPEDSEAEAEEESAGADVYVDPAEIDRILGLDPRDEFEGPDTFAEVIQGEENEQALDGEELEEESDALELDEDEELIEDELEEDFEELDEDESEDEDASDGESEDVSEELDEEDLEAAEDELEEEADESEDEVSDEQDADVLTDEATAEEPAPKPSFLLDDEPEVETVSEPADEPEDESSDSKIESDDAIETDSNESDESDIDSDDSIEEESQVDEEDRTPRLFDDLDAELEAIDD